MSIPKAVHTLLSKTNIFNIVGNRVLPVYAPLNTQKPFIIYKLDALNPTETKDSSRDMDIRGLTVMCYSENYNSLHTLFDTIRTEIVRTHETVEGVKIDSIILTNQDDDYDPEDKVYFGIQNFNIRING
jgi:hypothetical protein